MAIWDASIHGVWQNAVIANNRAGNPGLEDAYVGQCPYFQLNRVQLHSADIGFYWLPLALTSDAGRVDGHREYRS